MNRLIDRGALTAAYVGIGMALTIVASFTLIIPIEWVIWLLALPAGLVIGYYANQRANRLAGPGSRILLNGAFAGVVTGVSAAVLLLTVKALFFFADNGYRDAGQGGPLVCDVGAQCVYERYLDAGHGAELETAGVRDATDFTGLYWREQVGSAGAIVLLSGIGGLGGASLYGLFRPRSNAVDRPAALT